MSVTYDAWKSWESRIKSEYHAEQASRQMSAIVASRRAQTVVEHEGWQLFLDHLQGMLDLAKQRFEHERDAALEDPIHATLARELRERIKTLGEVMELIPRLIEQGKDLRSVSL